MISNLFYSLPTFCLACHVQLLGRRYIYSIYSIYVLQYMLCKLLLDCGKRNGCIFMAFFDSCQATLMCWRILPWPPICSLPFGFHHCLFGWLLIMYWEPESCIINLTNHKCQEGRSMTIATWSVLCSTHLIINLRMYRQIYLLMESISFSSFDIIPFSKKFCSRLEAYPISPVI